MESIVLRLYRTLGRIKALVPPQLFKRDTFKFIIEDEHTQFDIAGVARLAQKLTDEEDVEKPLK